MVSLLQLPYDAVSLLFRFPGTTAIEWFALTPKGEVLVTLLGAQSAKHPGRLLVVRVRNEPQSSDRKENLGSLQHSRRG